MLASVASAESTSRDSKSGTDTLKTVFEWVAPTARHRLLAASPEGDELAGSVKQLVEAIQTDTRAAARFYETLRPKIESTLFRVLRHNPAEFDDLVQVTFERVIRSIADGTFEGRSQLTTWACAIAAHVAIDYLRRRSHEQRIFETVEVLTVAPQVYSLLPERRLEARSEVRKVQGVLKRMKSRPATILVLHDMLGHSVPQVADLLDIKLAAAQSMLRRARQEFARRCSATARPSDHKDEPEA